jgi:hypothetical protein
MEMRSIVTSTAAGLIAFGMSACSGLDRHEERASLIVTITPSVSAVDVGSADGSSPNLGTVNVRAPFLSDDNHMPMDNTFKDVLLRSYRVTYARTDGGREVPQPFARSISGRLSTGGAASLSEFQAFQPGALQRAPFVNLLPRNGGRDHETGKPFVEMEVVIEVVGETLSGERVSGTARSPLTFSFHDEATRRGGGVV